MVAELSGIVEFDEKKRWCFANVKTRASRLDGSKKHDLHPTSTMPTVEHCREQTGVDVGPIFIIFVTKEMTTSGDPRPYLMVTTPFEDLPECRWELASHNVCMNQRCKFGVEVNHTST